MGGTTTGGTGGGTPGEFREKVAIAVIGALVGGALTFGTTWFFYERVQKPQLEIMRQQLKDAEEKASQEKVEKQAAEKRAEEAATRAEAAQAVIDARQKQWDEASYRLVTKISTDIRNVLADPRVWEDRPHPSIRQFAQQLVDDRDAARAVTLDVQRKVSADMSDIYAALDTDIDALQALLARTPPASETDIKTLVEKIQNGWAAKVRLINHLALQAMQNAGCPVTLAGAPGVPRTP